MFAVVFESSAPTGPWIVTADEIGDPFDLVTLHLVLHYSDDPGAVIREAARMLAPGGQLVIVDFGPHQQEFLRQQHAHRRLGFSDAELAQWFQETGLAGQTPVRLLGDPLTVNIWPATAGAIQ